MQRTGVQHLALCPGNVLAAVDGVGQQRMPQAGHVHSDLVGSSRFQAAYHFGDTAAGFHRAAPGRRVIGDGRLGRDGPFDAHAHRHARIAADGAVDLARGGNPAVRQGHVFAAHAARLKLAHELGLGDIVARHDHQTGGVLVQAVHDARAGDLRELRVAMQQAVEQRAAPVAGPGVGDQARRLVDDDPVRAFRDHAELNGFGREGQRVGRGLGPDGEFVAGADRLADLAWRPIDQDVAGFDPALQAVAGMVGQEAGQNLVEPVGARGGRHGYKLRLPAAGFVEIFVGAIVGNKICAGGCIRHGDKSYNQPAMLTPRIRFS